MVANGDNTQQLVEDSGKHCASVLATDGGDEHVQPSLHHDNHMAGARCPHIPRAALRQAEQRPHSEKHQRLFARSRVNSFFHKITLKIGRAHIWPWVPNVGVFWESKVCFWVGGSC